MKQTNKAFAHTSLKHLALGGSAAAAILLPQAVTQAMPQLFTKVAPLTAQTLPYCTGVCGSCGASCVGSVTVMAFLAVLAKIKGKHMKSSKLISQQQKEANT